MNAEAFWARVDQSGGMFACWEWQGGRGTGGYGLVPAAIGKHRAHRLAWQLAKGPIPGGLFVCHTCDNPPCCNPAHLFVGTHQDNMRDMWAKGRGPGVDRQNATPFIGALALRRDSEGRVWLMRNVLNADGPAPLSEKDILAAAELFNAAALEIKERLGITGISEYVEAEAA